MNSKPTISVVIPVKNEEDKIVQCIESILSQTLKPHEVIIVDGHSTDSTIENIIKFPVKIFYENYGTRGGARQVGIQKSKGEYIAFTDADCLPSENWLENLIKEFKIGIVGVGGGTLNVGTGIWQESISLALDTFLGSGNSIQDRVLKDKRFVKSISGCNCIYRKSDLLKVGGYDVNLSINEDTKLNLSLINIGKLVYVPNAVVKHNQDRGLYEFVKRMYSFGYGRGENKLFDIQILPSILSIGILFLYFFWQKIFYYFIFLYLLLILIFSIKITIRVKKIKYFITIPVIFILEHLSYTIGFWIGIFKNIGRSGYK